MKSFFHLYTLASLCVCAASVSAQEKTPVALTTSDEELLEMGVDAKNIKIVIGGGVDILHQVPANRRVVVSLDE